MELFFHNISALQDELDLARKASSVDEDLVSDLSVALQFAKDDHATTIINVESLLYSGKITWDYLWALFPPNVLVYRYDHLTEQDQILKLRVITQEEDPVMKEKYWALSCDIIANDGLKFGLAKEPQKIEFYEFRGEHKIQDLRVFPLKFHDQAEKVHHEALERGRRFTAMDKPCVRETSGPAMFENQKNYRMSYLYKFASHGRAIVDPLAFRTSNPNIKFIPRVHRSVARTELSEEQLVICTPHALGFSLGDKKWGRYCHIRNEMHFKSSE